MRTKIVGHRGAKGLAVENTLPGFKLAKKLGVDIIELDVQITKDKQFVVCHDDRLWRVNGSLERISDLTYQELRQQKLSENNTIPLLSEVLTIIDDVPVLVDIKISTELPALFALLAQYGHMDMTIGSQHPSVITYSKQHATHLLAFYHRRYLPFGVIRSAVKQRADGLTMKYFLMNPFIYNAARKRGIQIQIYSVDDARKAKRLHAMYPGVWFVTNHPDKLLAARDSIS